MLDTQDRASTCTSPSHSLPLTAIIYCEGNFASIDGKTANGLIRHSGKYKILSVIDSEKAGQDTGSVLDNKPNSIPLYKNLEEAISNSVTLPDYFIYGMAPASGMLSQQDRSIMLDAMRRGINIVNGLHEFLSEDAEFISARDSAQVEIIDIRKPPDKKDLRLFSGNISEVSCPRIAILGTDCAIGKRTTATILTDALNNSGINAVMISTGQTGLMQGARHGLAMDAVPSQFCAGELEAAVVEAFRSEEPDVIIIEGQGALSHPAFSTSSFILRGCCPDAVVLQHAPARKFRCDFETMPMPKVAEEIELIQTFSRTKVIGITLNHEGMSDKAVKEAAKRFEQGFNVPSFDPLNQEEESLVNMVLDAFPELGEA